jgi:hypothetical protein
VIFNSYRVCEGKQNALPSFQVNSPFIVIGLHLIWHVKQQTTGCQQLLAAF